MPESTRHREAFDRYYRLGPHRSLALLADALRASDADAPSLRSLEEWSSRYQWQDRITDIERHAREAENEARIAEIREMQERHAKEGLLLQQRGAEWLTGLAAEAVSAEAAIRALVEGVKLERLARGDVTERTEVQQGGDPRLERLTDDEFAQLLRMATGSVEGATPPSP